MINDKKWINVSEDIFFCREFNVISKEEYIDYLSRKIINRSISKIAIPKLVIPVTYKCNLDCKYCLNESNYINEYSLLHVKKILREFIKYVKENEHNKIIIEFSYGGEPTMDMEYLKGALDIIDSFKSEIKIIKRIATNCFFGESILMFIMHRFDYVIASLDGPLEINDINRLTKSGSSTFSIVIGNIRKLYNAGLLERISCVIFSDDIKYLKDVVNFFNHNFKKTEIRYGKIIPEGKAKHMDIKIKWSNVVKYINENSNRHNIKLVGVPSGRYISKKGCIHCVNPNWFLRQNKKIATCPNHITSSSLIIGQIEDDEVLIFKESLKRIKKIESIVKTKCKDCLLEFVCPSRCIRLINSINCSKRISKAKEYMIKLLKERPYAFL
jgi:radical SAM protein with 4Fe4S-binding SPASM domain